MNANDIALPPLPESRIVSYQTDSTMRSMELHTYSDEDMQSYARVSIEHFLNRSGQYVTNDASRQAAIDAAIEADRKRRMPPNEPFVIVIDRMYDGEGPSLAYWNGENYQFTDGDCYDREGDTLDGYSAEFLTDHQLEKRLFSDRKRRG